MDVLSLPDLKELSRHGGGPLMSFYLPTRPFGPDSQIENLARLKNLLKSAAIELSSLGFRPAETDSLLEPVRKLADDRQFWLRAEKGLALFVDDGVRVFRLPVAPAEMVVVGSRYHLRPLLALLGSDRKYHVLALSQKRARLFVGSASGLEEVGLGDVPTSLAEALKWDDFEKQSLQFHTGTSGAPGARRPAVFHGSGEPDPKEELLQYFRGIDRALLEHVHDGSPLVLAGVDYLLPLYREVNSYPALAPEAVTGNPTAIGEAALYQGSFEIASKMLNAGREATAERIVELWATPRTTSDPETYVPAAVHGRVEALFLGDGAELWGSIDETADTVEVHPVRHAEDEDLLDLAALRTILAGGDVFLVPPSEMPRGAAVVALLRY